VLTPRYQNPLEDEKLPPEGIATVVEEFEKDGVV